ncbi:MAG: hypothetical protein R2838_01165 [Caldilineaceae bacterium]
MFFNSYPDTLYFVALVAVDDPDTLAVLPVLARIVAAGPPAYASCATTANWPCSTRCWMTST